MGTNLHKITFSMLARNKRVKSQKALRKSRRSHSFLSHRFRSFVASDARLQVLCEHLEAISGHSAADSEIVILLTMIGLTPAEVIEWATEPMHQLYTELNLFISSICYVLNEICRNDVERKPIDVHFEYDLTSRPNVDATMNLMGELVSRLLQTYSSQCIFQKLPITRDSLCIFDLCYQKMASRRDVIERNLHTILRLTSGVGGFERSLAIVEYEPLMRQLMCHHGQHESLICLQIFDNIIKGFPENTKTLLDYNLLEFVKGHLNGSQPFDVVEKCAHIVENICGNCRSDVQAVIAADLIKPLINVLEPSANGIDFGLRITALNTILNICTVGSIDQMKVLLELDLLRLLCGQLGSQAHDDETILDVLNNILREFDRKEHHNFHQISNLIGSYGGYSTIAQLRHTNNSTICILASELFKFGNSNCVECNRASFEGMVE